MEEILEEIRGIAPGWAGPTTKAPNPWIVENFETIIARHLHSVRNPDEIEIDPDDGAITIYWSSRELKQTFSLSFQSRTTIIGVLTDLHNYTGYPPWRLPIEDLGSIQEKLNHPAVKILTTIANHNRSE
jgi:hypothetical protein